MVKYLSKSSFHTKKIARDFAKKILKTSLPEKALILTLEGQLGTGKTTFLQGFAKGLGIKEKILSPTFIIIRKIKIKNRKLNFKNFYHIDCYRIQKPKEILDLGFDKLSRNRENIIAIEWPEKIKKILTRFQKKIKIKISFLKNKNQREIKIIFKN